LKTALAPLGGDDAAQVGAVVRITRDVLDARVIGAYLHGSAALGGLKPTSDLDILAVLREPTTFDERRHGREALQLSSMLAFLPELGGPAGDA
jgi:predicted nucleotidyltransferase